MQKHKNLNMSGIQGKKINYGRKEFFLFEYKFIPISPRTHRIKHFCWLGM